MPNFTVVYDACVLYPAPLRDLLVRLALTGLVRARWTEQIHDEWTRNLLKNRLDLTPDRVRRTRALMDSHVNESLITGYEPLIGAMELPDPDDRHVLAAAVWAEAQVIVTYNLADFPADYLSNFGVRPLHPDAFVSDLLDLNADAACEAVRQQRAALNRRPTVDQLLNTFTRQRLPQTVERLRAFADRL